MHQARGVELHGGPGGARLLGSTVHGGGSESGVEPQPVSIFDVEGQGTRMLSMPAPAHAIMGHVDVGEVEHVLVEGLLSVGQVRRVVDGGHAWGFQAGEAARPEKVLWRLLFGPRRLALR